MAAYSFVTVWRLVMRSGAKGICGLLGGVKGTCAWVEG